MEFRNEAGKQKPSKYWTFVQNQSQTQVLCPICPKTPVNLRNLPRHLAKVHRTEPELALQVNLFEGRRCRKCEVVVPFSELHPHRLCVPNGNLKEMVKTIVVKTVVVKSIIVKAKTPTDEKFELARKQEEVRKEDESRKEKATNVLGCNLNRLRMLMLESIKVK